MECGIEKNKQLIIRKSLLPPFAALLSTLSLSARISTGRISTIWCSIDAGYFVLFFALWIFFLMLIIGGIRDVL